MIWKFKVRTRSQSVSLYGGMMLLDVPTAVGQTLSLINRNTGQKTQCRVVAVRTGRDGGAYVAFEFQSPMSNRCGGASCLPPPPRKSRLRILRSNTPGAG
jgi:hypothetical protein